MYMDCAVQFMAETYSTTNRNKTNAQPSLNNTTTQHLADKSTHKTMQHNQSLHYITAYAINKHTANTKQSPLASTTHNYLMQTYKL